MDKANRKLILIIDNNIANGTYLSGFSKTFGTPVWDIRWLRICNGDSEISKLSEDADCDIVASISEASNYILREARERPGLIIFYNLQLGLSQRTVDAALGSSITMAIKDVIGQSGQVLVNLHAADISTRKVAEFMTPCSSSDNPFRAQIICQHSVTGAPISKIASIVKQSLIGWQAQFCPQTSRVSLP